MAGDLGERKILHVDMDAFFVSVELRRRPELLGRPVVVGGSGSRGVVAAASYEARRFGVRSAMASAQARRLCPDAVFLPGDHEHYQEVSTEVLEILGRFTPLVEPLSLDEAFLDVTGAEQLLGDAVTLAGRIRHEVAAELGLGCSVGVAPNKFIAKLASVEAKPRASSEGVFEGYGVFVVESAGIRAYLDPLPVERLWGVGPVTLARLHGVGIRHIRDLAQVDVVVLEGLIGRASAHHLSRLAQGLDDRAVEPSRPMKSLGHEQTYAADLRTPDEIQRELVRLADAVSARLRRRETPARTITLKIRFGDFRSITRSVTSQRPLQTMPGILAQVEPMLAAADVQGWIGESGVRLLGISASNFEPVSTQLGLFDLDDSVANAQGSPSDAERLEAALAIDQIRSRFGASAIGPASSVSPSGLDVMRRGEQQWGPQDDSGRTGPDPR